MGKVKILFVLDSISIGGAEKVMLKLFRKIDKDKFDKLLSTFHVNSNVELDFSPVVLGNQTSSVFKLLRLIFEFQPKIIFVCLRKSMFVTSFLKLILLLTRNRDFFFVLRESSIPSKQLLFTRHNKILYSLFLKMAYRLFDVIIVQSHDMLVDLNVNFKVPLRKLKKIFNPISTSEITESRVISIKIPIFVTVGNLRPEKGHLRIIKALSLIPKDVEFEYLILGDGIQYSAISKLVNENGLRDKVKFLGQVKSNEISSFLSKASLFLQGSHSEGFPNSLVEACLNKVPVITFDIPGGTREIISNGFNGFLVPDNDLVAYKNAILDARDYNFPKEEFPSFIMSNFGEEKIISLYNKFFLQCVE